MNDSRSSAGGQPVAGPDDDTVVSASDRVTPVPSAGSDATIDDAAPDDGVARTPGLARGALVGRWVVLDRLGQGGMGVVYAAYDPELDRRVAIKLLPPDEAGRESSVGRTRLLREAQSMARLSHPNVVAVYDVGAIAAGVYIAMEHIDGVTLSTWLDERPRSRREILRVFEAAGRGIEAAHGAGLVHRDFKPDNVMVGHDGRVRVLDFGLARPAKSLDPDAGERVDSSGGWSAASHLELELTVPGTVVGTPRYMAPEQHLGKPADERSDVYAFCVALWEAVYGARPFSGKSLPELASKIIVGQIDEPPRSAKVPRWLRALLRRGMAPDPAARFASMGELLAALGHDREARNRKIAVAAGLAVVTAVGGIALYRSTRVQLCREADAVLDGVWDGPRKSAIEAAFEREGKTYTAASWRAVERELDGYGAALVAMRREACEASRVHGTQSDELLGRRMACLDRRVHKLAALGDALIEGGSATMLGAVEAVHGLPDLAPCADVERLSRGVAPPEDPAVRERVEAVRAEIDHIRGPAANDEVEGLLVHLGEVLARARATEYRPLVAEALRAQGGLLANLSRIDAARAALLEGLDHAEATGHDPMIVEISIVLIHVEGSSRNQFELAELHARRAQAVIERLGGDERLQVQLWHEQGVLRSVQDRHPEAVELHRRALELAEQIDLGGPRRLPILNALASSLMGADRADEAAAVIERAQLIVDADLGPEHPNAGALLAMLGRLRSQQGRNQEALMLLQRARAIFVASLGGEHPNVAAMANSLGLVLSSLGRDDEALAAYTEALAILERNSGKEHMSVATALQNLTLLELRRGNGAQALAHIRRVLEIRVPKLGEVHESVALAKDLLGDAHALLGEREEARAAYSAAIDIFGRVGKPESQAYAHVGLARLWLAEARYDQAIAAGERALALHTAATSDSDRARARFILAQALHGAGRDGARVDELLAQARQYYGAAGPTWAHELEGLERWAASRGPTPP